jgi:hypothetical protein
MRYIHTTGRRLLGAAVAVVVTGAVLVTAAFVPATADTVAGPACRGVGVQDSTGGVRPVG